MSESEKDKFERVRDKETGRIKGIFSTQSIIKIGTGTTTRKTIQKTYWMVEELEDGQFQIQPLNKNYVPAGAKKLISREEFFKKFYPEPEFYINTVYPKMRELQKTIARADRHRMKGETYSAEYEYKNALKIDEENIRATFGLGLTYLDRGEKEKANDVFQRLVKLDAAFEKEHKHLFNEFGIKLRKNKLLDQCIEYYKRALELTQDDEHLFHNIARAYYEKGDINKTVEYLKKALEINPKFEEGKRFLDFLKKKGQLKN